LGRFGYADADGRGNVVRRRDKDIEFLAWVRDASLDELRAHAYRFNKVEWKKIAVARAIERRSR
jgi:hypothetical protein